MKYKYLYLVLALFIVLSLCNYCFAERRDDNKKANLLSVNEIDLLVGTPEGVAEPLDSRRNKFTKDNKIDYSCYLDENALTDDTSLDLSWEDAEDSSVNENQVEDQLMNLLAETEELEKIDEIYYNDDEIELATYTEILDDNKMTSNKLLKRK